MPRIFVIGTERIVQEGGVEKTFFYAQEISDDKYETPYPEAIHADTPESLAREVVSVLSVNETLEIRELPVEAETSNIKSIDVTDRAAFYSSLQ